VVGQTNIVQRNSLLNFFNGSWPNEQFFSPSTG
jgi:hypothetical protein